MARKGGDIPAVSQRVQVTESLFNDFTSSARKYTGFSGDFKQCDLSGLIARLAAGIALFTTTGKLTAADLTAGQAVRVGAMGFSVGPVTNGTGNVWLSQNVDDPTSPNVLFAIACATTGAGGTLITDCVALNAENRPILVTVEDEELVWGCYNALRIIGSNYSQNDCGSVFAYAVTVGLHGVLSVVGQTDEGAYMRKVLRRLNFCAPYGGIRSDLRGWEGLPRPTVPSVEGWTALVDNILLVTAACVSVADPCVIVNGRTFPSIFASDQAVVGDSGVFEDGNDSDALDLAHKIYASSGPFCRNYISALARVFDFTQSAVNVAAQHFTAAFGHNTAPDRHLKLKVAAPFFWIEPTGVLDNEMSEYAACRAGYGPLCTFNESKTHKWFDEARCVDRQGGVAVYEARWRSARTSHIMTHLGNHAEDGLAYGRIIASDPSLWVNVGGTSKPFAARMTTGDDLASYAWRRSDVAICAPAEMMYTGTAIRMVVKESTIDETTWRATAAHFPTSDEILGGGVTYTVTRMAPLGVGEIGPSRSAKRVLTGGARALSDARYHARDSLRHDPALVVMRDVAWDESATVASVTRDASVMERDKAPIISKVSAHSVLVENESKIGVVEPVPAMMVAGTQSGPKVPQTASKADIFPQQSKEPVAITPIVAPESG
jgi:hypothetical protein